MIDPKAPVKEKEEQAVASAEQLAELQELLNDQEDYRW